MSQYLIAIALLCQIHPGNSGSAITYIANAQKECQQRISKCLIKKKEAPDAFLECLAGEK